MTNLAINEKISFMVELIGGPHDGRVIEVPDQKYGPYVIQMVHIWEYAQLNGSPFAEYYLATDGNYYYFQA